MQPGPHSSVSCTCAEGLLFSPQRPGSVLTAAVGLLGRGLCVRRLGYPGAGLLESLIWGGVGPTPALGFPALLDSHRKETLESGPVKGARSRVGMPTPS